MKLSGMARITIDRKLITKNGTLNKSFKVSRLLADAIKHNPHVSGIPISIK